MSQSDPRPSAIDSIGILEPVEEQQHALRLFQTGESIRIDAYAGTGKTTTLRLLANSTPRRGLYLAFNRSIASDAQSRFPLRFIVRRVIPLRLEASGEVTSIPSGNSRDRSRPISSQRHSVCRTGSASLQAPNSGSLLMPPSSWPE
jgi:hypothetical protein